MEHEEIQGCRAYIIYDKCQSMANQRHVQRSCTTFLSLENKTSKPATHKQLTLEQQKQKR